MSIASNATDQQVGAVLEAIQSVTPDVLAQAIQYYRVVNSVWLGFCLMVATVLVIVFRQNLSMWEKHKKDIDAFITVFSGCGIFICFVFSVACVNSLVKITMAPDYYAAERLAALIHQAIGR